MLELKLFQILFVELFSHEAFVDCLYQRVESNDHKKQSVNVLVEAISLNAFNETNASTYLRSIYMKQIT